MQVAFISQEAREKAREIQVKADEEFAIEKVSLGSDGGGLRSIDKDRKGRERLAEVV